MTTTTTTTVDYNHEQHGGWAQYHRRAAGYYRSFSHAARRAAEIAAHRDGVTVAPLYRHMQKESANGAPGIIGWAPTAAEVSDRRADAYPRRGVLP